MKEQVFRHTDSHHNSALPAQNAHHSLCELFLMIALSLTRKIAFTSDHMAHFCLKQEFFPGIFMETSLGVHKGENSQGWKRKKSINRSTIVLRGLLDRNLYLMCGDHGRHLALDCWQQWPTHVFPSSSLTREDGSSWYNARISTWHSGVNFAHSSGTETFINLAHFALCRARLWSNWFSQQWYQMHQQQLLTFFNEY